jgi:hypothetical protein
MENPIPLSVRKLCNKIVTPFEENPWFDGKPITGQDIAQAIASNKLRKTPLTPWKNKTHEKLMTSKAYHVQRIAYLAVSGWTDPIQIDVGIPALGYDATEFICDGWHRFAAAIYKKDKEILCSWSGQENIVSGLRHAKRR